MSYGSPDRVSFFEEGLREDVLEAWRRQGLPADADLERMFRFDRRERIGVNIEPLGGRKRPIRGRADLRELRRRLDPGDPRRLPADWADRVAGWRGREGVLELPLHRGLLLTMGVGDWRTFEEAIYLLADEPALVREILDLHADLSAAMAERILREVEVDFVSFSEPIAGSDGPVVAPKTYEEVVLASYRPVLDVARAHGVETIALISYANPGPLLPEIVRAGFNCLWACEVNGEAMDYREIRRRFGRDLRLIGGIDLDVLLAGEAAIRREIEAKVPPLLADGGYIPLADGRIRETVPFDNYCCYRRLLEALV